MRASRSSRVTISTSPAASAVSALRSCARSVCAPLATSRNTLSAPAPWSAATCAATLWPSVETSCVAVNHPVIMQIISAQQRGAQISGSARCAEVFISAPTACRRSSLLPTSAAGAVISVLDAPATAPRMTAADAQRPLPCSTSSPATRASRLQSRPVLPRPSLPRPAPLPQMPRYPAARQASAPPPPSFPLLRPSSLC